MLLLPEEPTLDFSKYSVIGVGIILMVGRVLVMQQRDDDAPTDPGKISQWGGAVEPEDASPRAAARRELGEELGAYLEDDDLLFLGAAEFQKGPTLAIRYFARIAKNRIGRCEEGKARLFKRAADALTLPKLHRPGTEWSLTESLRRGLIPR